MPDSNRTFSGTWVTSTSSSDRYGSNYLHSNKQATENVWVKFTPDIPSNATYDVSFYFNGNESRGSAIPVEIVYDGGVATNLLDQSCNPKKRVTIGSYPFAKGTSGYVKLMTLGQSGKYVIADAVRFAVLEVKPADHTTDRDGNGIYDSWERVHFLRAQGTDPEADPDGDGQSNRCEFVVGSDPNVVNHPFAIDDLAPSDTGSLSLAWKGVAGRVYRVKQANSPGGPYEDCGAPVVADADENCSIEIQTSVNPSAAFFKIEVLVQ